MTKKQKKMLIRILVSAAMLMLLELVPNMQIVAIGQKAADTLSRYGIACKAVRHPSMGGAETFRAQVAELFKKQQK